MYSTYTTLDIVMKKLDTITDFVSYLEKKEKFILSGRLIWAAGEEELLAYYLKYINDDEEHDFIVPSNIKAVSLYEGLWERFTRSTERRNQLKADEISYAWDDLIEKFAFHILENTQHFSSHPGIRDQEKILRFLAREPRTRRRMLSHSIHDLIWRTPDSSLRAVRVIAPSRPGDPYYIFLLLSHLKNLSYEEYREFRRQLLGAYCQVVKLKFPDAQDIVGLATETGRDAERSEDALYFDARNWTDEEQAEAQRLHDEGGLLNETRMFASTEKEYPDQPFSSMPPSVHTKKHKSEENSQIKQSKKPSKAYKNKIGRGAPCPCQSGKTYSRCHGKGPGANKAS